MLTYLEVRKMIKSNLKACGQGLAYNSEGNINNVLNFLPNGFKVLKVTFFLLLQILYHKDYPRRTVEKEVVPKSDRVEFCLIMFWHLLDL